MSFAPIIHALALPTETRVDQRVPKKLLVENGAPTAGDKKQINDGIEEILWQAALKPANLGVPAFRDAVREYLEIAVLTVIFRPTAKPARLVELIHRAIPYPLLLAAQPAKPSVSPSHTNAGPKSNQVKVVIEELRAHGTISPRKSHD